MVQPVVIYEIKLFSNFSEIRFYLNLFKSQTKNIIYVLNKLLCNQNYFIFNSDVGSV